MEAVNRLMEAVLFRGRRAPGALPHYGLVAGPTQDQCDPERFMDYVFASGSEDVVLTLRRGHDGAWRIASGVSDTPAGPVSLLQGEEHARALGKRLGLPGF